MMDLNSDRALDLQTFCYHFWSYTLLNLAFAALSIAVMHKLVLLAVGTMNDYLIHHTQVVVLGIAEPIPQPGPWIACAILVARELAIKRF